MLLFEYGNASTNIASKTTFQKYEKIQRQFATWILRYPSHVSNNIINKNCNLDSIKDRNLYLSKKMVRENTTAIKQCKTIYKFHN